MTFAPKPAAPKRIRTVIGGVLIAIAAALLLRPLLPKPTLEQQARQYFECLQKGDADCLYQGASVDEQVIVSRDALAFICRDIPTLLAGWQPGPLVVRDSPETGSCTITQRYTKDRSSVELFMEARQGETQVEILAARTATMVRYALEFPNQQADLPPTVGFRKSLLEGLERDRAKLESLGMMGMPGTGGGDGQLLWDLYFERNRDIVAELMQKQ